MVYIEIGTSYLGKLCWKYYCRFNSRYNIYKT
nr:MAG TPA_asm: hypothetical protein [Bacteriophage sp.]DAT27282.1 MAG TPA: hypothetical protein [Caudoviricetes sp.]